MQSICFESLATTLLYLPTLASTRNHHETPSLHCYFLHYFFYQGMTHHDQRKAESPIQYPTMKLETHSAEYTERGGIHAELLLWRGKVGQLLRLALDRQPLR